MNTTLSCQRMRCVGCAVALLLTSACTDEGVSSSQLVLGPDAATTVYLDSPTVHHRIGDRSGPGTIEQGFALMMAPDMDGGVLVYASYSTGQPIQLFHEGQFIRAFGRSGSGPGEYQRVGGFAVDHNTGEIWVLDTGRLVSFSSGGEAGKVVYTSHAGGFARGLIVLPDGSLLLNGPGGSRDNLGYLLHQYIPSERVWRSHHPVLRDSAFSVMDDSWQRDLAVTSDGRVIAVSDEFLIEVFDRDFQLVRQIRRIPESWPADIAADYEARRRDDPLSPAYAVTDAWVDGENRLWVLASMPDPRWRDKVGSDPRRPWVERSLVSATDFGRDSLIEVIDLSTLEVKASYRVDELLRFIVGDGLFAYYAGDLPFPQLEVLKVPL